MSEFTNDIFCLGETLIRLTATSGRIVSDMGDLRPYIGGAEANIAVGLAKLDHKVKMLSVIPDNDLGNAAKNELRKHGVNTDNIIYSQGRMGLYFLSPGAIHRPSEIIYDRENSSFAQFEFNNFNWEKLLKGSKWLHVSGVTAALGENAYNGALAAMVAARKMGIKISYDGNFRPKLWEKWRSQAPDLILKLMEQADLIFGSHRDFELVFKTEFQKSENIEALAANFAFDNLPNLGLIANTEREQISASFNRLSGNLFTKDKNYKTPIYDIDRIVDRIGGGDAFAVGIFHGLLSNLEYQSTLEYGIASACLKHAQLGDLCLNSKQMLEDFLNIDGFDVKR